MDQYTQYTITGIVGCSTGCDASRGVHAVGCPNTGITILPAMAPTTTPSQQVWPITYPVPLPTYYNNPPSDTLNSITIVGSGWQCPQCKNCWAPTVIGCYTCNAAQATHTAGIATDDMQQGAYRRYEVKRLDDAAGKHAGCDYFVLDWKHDQFTVAAMRAYADACEAQFPKLAKDIRARIHAAPPSHE